MFCIKCGKENREGAKVCYFCGALLINQQPPAQAAISPVEENTTTANPTPVEQKVTETDATPTEKPANPVPPETPPSPYPNNPPYNYGQNSYPPPYGQGFRPSPPGFGGPHARFPTAPSGIPYVVLENPRAFHNYTNKDGKQVYAVYSSFTIRALGAIIDSFIMSVPGFFISLLIYWLMVPTSDLTSGNIDPNSPVVLQATNWIVLISGTLFLLYTVLMTTFYGQTLGHRAVGIKVMKVDGEKVDFNNALVRNLFGYSWIISRVLVLVESDIITLIGFLLGTLVLIGFAAVLWHPQRQGWHDRLAGTVVVHRVELVKDTNF